MSEVIEPVTCKAVAGVDGLLGDGVDDGEGVGCGLLEVVHELNSTASTIALAVLINGTIVFC